MKNKIIIAAHGTYALGIQSAVELISGCHEEVCYLSMYVDPTIDYEKEVEILLQKSCATANVIVLSDLSGGSVNRLFMRLLPRYPFHLLTNVNLGIVLELIYANQCIDAAYLEALLSKKMMKAIYCNPLLQKMHEEGEEEPIDD